jgi:D-xylose transport system substrate-binding protein
VKLAKHEIIIAKQTVNNGKREVPSILNEVVTVTRENMVDTIIKDGFHPFDEVYRGIPEANRPPKPAAAAAKP